MPFRRLPSLSALRAFEAAARHGSFKSAAGELSVTPGAVSQQIRLLEADLGVALFLRTGREVKLTEAGMVLRPGLTAAFLQMHETLEKVRPSSRTTLRLNATASVITKWLMPRLHRFTSKHPNLDVRVETEYALNAFDETGPDVSIRLTETPPDTLYARKLHDELLLPAASPAFIERENLRGPKDLYRVPLVHDASLEHVSEHLSWKSWFAAAGLMGEVPDTAIRFEQFSADYVVDHAVAGGGVILGRSLLVHEALSDGRLMCPFGPLLAVDWGYYLLCRKDRKDAPAIRAFMDWAVQEAAMLSTLRAMHLEAG